MTPTGVISRDQKIYTVGDRGGEGSESLGGGLAQPYCVVRVSIRVRGWVGL